MKICCYTTFKYELMTVLDMPLHFHLARYEQKDRHGKWRELCLHTRFCFWKKASSLVEYELVQSESILSICWSSSELSSLDDAGFAVSVGFFIHSITILFSSYNKAQVNQVGTVTEAIEAVKLAKDANWGVVISQRSGESEDSFLADIAVGLATGQIKAGAPCRGERLAKYNQVNI